MSAVVYIVSRRVCSGEFNALFQSMFICDMFLLLLLEGLDEGIGRVVLVTKPGCIADNEGPPSHLFDFRSNYHTRHTHY